MLSFDDCKDCGASCAEDADIMKRCSDDGYTEYDFIDGIIDEDGKLIGLTPKQVAKKRRDKRFLILSKRSKKKKENKHGES